MRVQLNLIKCCLDWVPMDVVKLGLFFIMHWVPMDVVLIGTFGSCLDWVLKDIALTGSVLAKKDKEVDKLGQEEDKEALVKEPRRCIERGHIPRVLSPGPPSPPLNPASLTLLLPRQSPPQGTSAWGHS